MIDVFDKATFEAALPVAKASGEPLWYEVDPEDGEYCYVIPIDGRAGIMVRSSVHVGTGRSADSGEDSIRAWLIEIETGRPLGKKVTRWTTRLVGWANRLVNNADSVVRTLWIWRMRAGDCPYCYEPLRVAKVTDKNKETFDRPYASCWNKSCPGQKKPGTFRWLDEDGKTPPYFHNNGIHTGLETRAVGRVEEPGPQTVSGDLLPLQRLTGQDILVHPPAEPVIKAINYGDRIPNPPQLAAIEMPLEASVRVISPAGSGKTTVIAYRYAWLIAQGIDPANILAVTFSKTMADELHARVVKVCPEVIGTAAAQQICTIHALCKRLLSWHYGDRRDVAPEWEQRAALQTISENVWPRQELRPGYAEISDWISSAKARGFAKGMDEDYFVDQLGDYHGKRLSRARAEFDQVMKAGGKKQNPRGLMTFPDMVFEVEHKMRTDPAFRAKWQAQFRFVIIDEGQDTSAQALRILLTLSFSPNDNRIYDHWKPGQAEIG